MARFDPSRQPVERSCCMSTPTLVETSRTLRGHHATIGDRSGPSADMMNTETTKALEIGF